MKRLMAVLVLVAGSTFAADAKKDAPAPKAAGFVLGGDAAKGEATYKMMCVSCHGETGKGDGVAAAALTPKPADFTDAARAAAATDEYLYKIIKDGGAANGKSPMMAPWGAALNDDQKLRDVAAYVRTFAKPAAPAAPAKDAKPAAKK